MGYKTKGKGRHGFTGFEIVFCNLLFGLGERVGADRELKASGVKMT